MKHTFVRLLAAFSLFVCSLASAQVDPIFEKAGELPIPYGVQSMAWHPNGKWLAVGYFNHDFVEVWDIQTKQSVLKVPSKRRPINQSGQELVFSPDGKYLVVQDYVDTDPNYVRAKTDDAPSELAARKDTQRLILARVWNLEQKKEVAQLRGAGSRFHGGNLIGMCFTAGQTKQLTLLRRSSLSVYNLPTGKFAHEVNLRFPIAEKPNFPMSYWQMDCHSSRSEIAVTGGEERRADRAAELGVNPELGATPIVIVDMGKRAVKQTLLSPTGIAGVAFTADGKQMLARSRDILRVWDTAHYRQIAEITMPNMNTQVNIIPIANFQGALTTGNGIQIWNTKKMNLAYSSRLPPSDLFRVAVHHPSGLYALPIYSEAISFFKLDSKKLVQLTQQ